jgi:hypothetical protein
LNPETVHQLTSRAFLFPTGLCLVMVGIFLRGFASSARRELARRKQHLLDERKSGEAELNRDLEKPPGWMERNFGSIANTVLVAGVVITLVSLFQK